MEALCCGRPSAEGRSSSATLTIALIGNPNCGKTTLFNVLTGAHQRVGNWPGVTVECKRGYFDVADWVIEVIDLPGLYSLVLAGEAAVDERIAAEFILQQQVDLIINIVDASHLERHLYLTTQLLEMGVPMILALNMMDVARARGMQLDVSQLSQLLGCPVIALEARKRRGIDELKHALLTDPKTPSTLLPYPLSVQQALEALTSQGIAPPWLAIRLLEEDKSVRHLVANDVWTQVAAQQTHILAATGEEADIVLADARYDFIQTLLQRCLVRGVTQKTWTARLDDVVLNRLLGIPIFLGMMYLLFLFAINVGGVFQDFFDMASQTIFVDGLAYGLTYFNTPSWLTALLANGVGKGINTVVTFIPVLGTLFFLLALLEDSGYMTRAAFVIDRAMRTLGLPGKAFVPMIVGLGCNVPAVMATRTLENKRDRILAIMMSPFMSCGARLAIYVVFVTAFFPQRGQNVIFALYLVGIGMAILTGVMLRQTILKGDTAPLIMELPAYHIPHMRTLFLHTWQRLKGFVLRAGQLIVPICVLIGALNSLNIDGSLNTSGDGHSILSLLGQKMTPIFAPMGIQADNWPATVSLVTGVLAKEVVIGTLNTLYTQMGHLHTLAPASTFDFWGGLQAAGYSILENMAQLKHLLSHPIVPKGPLHTLNQETYGLMYQHFDGQIGAFAYLLFVLLYLPCISTTAAMLRELHRGWALFSAGWMTGVAYGTAVVFYQVATWQRHPWYSLIWVSVIVALFLGILAFIRWYAHHLLQENLSPLSVERPI